MVGDDRFACGLETFHLVLPDDALIATTPTEWPTKTVPPMTDGEDSLCGATFAFHFAETASPAGPGAGVAPVLAAS